MSMRETFTDVVSDLIESDPRVAVVTADIGVGRFHDSGVADRHPARVLNLGIREQAMIGVAAGLALEGLRPIVHSYAPFLVERPFEQIKLDLVHQGVGAVLVSIAGSYDAAGEGRTHQAPEDVALLATLPDVEIVVPGHALEVDETLRSAVRHDGTVYVRLSETQNRVAFPADGRVRPVRHGSGTAVTVLAVGPMLDPVLDAVADLDVTVLYASTLAPFDVAGIRSLAGDSLVVVEPYLTGTTVPTLVAALGDRPTRIGAFGVDRGELRRYGTPGQHRAARGLDATGIRKRLEAWMGRTPALLRAAAV